MTQDALLDALEASYREPDDPEGALTAREIATAMGVSLHTARRRLSEISDRIEVVRVTRERLDGEPRKVPAYRLKAA